MKFGRGDSTCISSHNAEPLSSLSYHIVAPQFQVQAPADSQLSRLHKRIIMACVMLVVKDQSHLLISAALETLLAHQDSMKVLEHVYSNSLHVVLQRCFAVGESCITRLCFQGHV